MKKNNTKRSEQCQIQPENIRNRHKIDANKTAIGQIARLPCG